MKTLEEIKELKNQVENWRQVGIACAVAVVVFAPLAFTFGGWVPLMANPSAFLSIGFGLLSAVSFSVGQVKSVRLKKIGEQAVPADPAPAVLSAAKGSVSKASASIKFSAGAAPAVKGNPAPPFKNTGASRKHD